MDDDSRFFISWLVVAAACACVYFVGGTNVVWYSVRYMINPTKVQVSAEPREVQLPAPAPLRSKGCQYSAVARAYNAAGDWIGGEGSPQYADTKDGNLLISYDGKTWWTYLGPSKALDLKVDNVKVTWNKVTE